ncbi:unnamed protein product [Amoebophrya sp. A25]|nr:unnamed protein product [Amoebophrya sp. A25]|eukprot:GSA25T00015311001.1
MWTRIFLPWLALLCLCDCGYAYQRKQTTSLREVFAEKNKKQCSDVVGEGLPDICGGIHYVKARKTKKPVDGNYVRLTAQMEDKYLVEREDPYWPWNFATDEEIDGDIKDPENVRKVCCYSETDWCAKHEDELTDICKSRQMVMKEKGAVEELEKLLATQNAENARTDEKFRATLKIEVGCCEPEKYQEEVKKLWLKPRDTTAGTTMRCTKLEEKYLQNTVCGGAQPVLEGQFVTKSEEFNEGEDASNARWGCCSLPWERCNSLTDEELKQICGPEEKINRDGIWRLERTNLGESSSLDLVRIARGFGIPDLGYHRKRTLAYHNLVDHCCTYTKKSHEAAEQKLQLEVRRRHYMWKMNPATGKEKLLDKVWAASETMAAREPSWKKRLWETITERKPWFDKTKWLAKESWSAGKKECKNIWDSFSPTVEEANFWLCGGERSQGLAESPKPSEVTFGTFTGEKWTNSAEKENTLALLTVISEIQKKCCSDVPVVDMSTEPPRTKTVKCSDVPRLATEASEMGYDSHVSRHSYPRATYHGNDIFNEQRMQRWIRELCGDAISPSDFISSTPISVPDHVVKDQETYLRGSVVPVVPANAWWWWSDQYGDPMPAATLYFSRCCPAKQQRGLKREADASGSSVDKPAEKRTNQEEASSGTLESGKTGNAGEEQRRGADAGVSSVGKLAEESTNQGELSGGSLKTGDAKSLTANGGGGRAGAQTGGKKGREHRQEGRARNKGKSG